MEENFGPNISDFSAECCIFRVNEELRQVNPRAYEPQTIAIGPYHRGKAHLKSMEMHKVHCLNSLLARRGEKSSKKYTEAIQVLEQKARKCYADTIKLKQSEFVEMLVLDGIFILELLQREQEYIQRDNNDSILNIELIRVNIRRDLWLFENQIPFFVLLELFNKTKLDSQTPKDLISFALTFSHCFRYFTQSIDSFPLQNVSNNFKHLLDLFHSSSSSSVQKSDPTRVAAKSLRMQSITELQEAGIEFKKIEGRPIFDIRFTNGKMKIPCLEIYDETETLFRNLIAYEQYCLEQGKSIYSHYIAIMDNLISSPKDGEILRRCGIIENYVGVDYAVSTMFNSLGQGIIVDPESYGSYQHIYNKVNDYCKIQCHVWMATLRRNHLSSPWLLISLLAATLLLVLTILQTVYTMLTYFKTF